MTPLPESKKDLSEEDIRIRYITPALHAAGWDAAHMLSERYFTDGRVVMQGRFCARRKGYRYDYLLFAADNYPVAVVEAKDNTHPVGGGLQQAIEYAKILDVPFAYSGNGDAFREHDLTTGQERDLPLDDFPSPDELRDRYRKSRSLTPEQQRIVDEPYYCDANSHTPRYYQRIAINRTVEAVAKGQRRILLVMATGTGKTFTAFQIIHRLHHSGLKKRILYLADRNALIDQTMLQDFKPFAKIMTKIQHKDVQSAYEIHLGLYGQLVDYENEHQPYEDFSRDYFDLIIVDECHRGSVRDDSEWRRILAYFASATQIGLTATPKAVDGASNIDYFCTESNGEPLYTYSLRQGIADGFLAPYRVTRSFLSIDLEGWKPSENEQDLFSYYIEQRRFNRPDFGRRIAIETRRRVVARRITKMLHEIGRMTKTIVFCPDQEEASALRDILAEMNWDMMRRDPRYVMRITSDDKTGRRQIDNFIDPDEPYPTVVTTSELLSTGVDCKTCGLIVFDKEVESMTSFKQMLGRGTRIKEDHGKLHFEILDFRDVTKKFYDPAFDSDADEDGPTRRGTPGDPPKPPPPPPPPHPPKYHIHGQPATVSHEVVSYLGLDGKLKTENLRDYNRRALTKRFATLHDFVAHWSAADRKQAILDELKEGDTPFLLDAVLEENPSLADKDVFDVIVHVAFDQKPLTRRERAENVKKRNYLARYEGRAREVLAALLDKFADRGVIELENEDVLELNPFSDIGTPVRIMKVFGGPDRFDAALRDLERELYTEAL